MYYQGQDEEATYLPGGEQVSAGEVQAAQKQAADFVAWQKSWRDDLGCDGRGKGKGGEGMEEWGLGKRVLVVCVKSKCVLYSSCVYCKASCVLHLPCVLHHAVHN